MKAKLSFILLLSPLIILTAQFDPELLVRGTAEYKAGNYTEAIKYFDEILEQDPTNPVAYFKRSYSHYYLANYSAALTDIEKAYDFKPLDKSYFFMKGMFYDKLKEHELGSYYINLAIRSDPDRLYYRSYRAALYLEMGKYAEAEKDFNYIIGSDSHNYNAYYGRGLSKYNRKMRTDACLDWLYARDQNANCKQFFFYKCTDLDLRGLKTQATLFPRIIKPVFYFESDSSIENCLSSNLAYTPESYLYGREEMILVKFTITKNLEIENIALLNEPNKSVGMKIIKLLENSKPYWKHPARNNDVELDFSFMIPISFRMGESDILKSKLKDSISYFIQENRVVDAKLASKKLIILNPFLKESYTDYLALCSKLKETPEIHINEIFEIPDEENLCLLDEVKVTANYTKTYYNDVWEITNVNNAKYVRVNKQQSYAGLINGEFQDFYADSSTYSKGAYSKQKKNGEFIFYFPNGLIEKKFRFKHNNPTDTAFYYFPNGELQSAVLINDQYFEPISCFNSDGAELITDGSGTWELLFTDYKGVSTYQIVGPIRNFKKHGTWQLFIEDEVIATEDYKNGELSFSTYYENGKKVKSDEFFIKTWLILPFSITRTEKLLYDSGAFPIEGSQPF